MKEVQRKGGLGLASRVEATFKTEKRADLIEHEIDQASLRLRDRRRNLLAQLSDFLPARVLDKREAFLVLRRLLNPDPRKAATPGLKYDTHVDYYAPVSPLSAFRYHLRVDPNYPPTFPLTHPHPLPSP